MSDESVRKPRGPRAEFTSGDLATLKRFGALEAKMEEHAGNASFQAALKALARKDHEVAALLGVSADGRTLDKRKGVFVSLAGLGAKMGDSATVEPIDGDSVKVTLVRS
jgi:hypothetical protein